MERKKYKDFSEDQKRKAIEAATRYNREVAARTTIKMTKELDAAMVKYIEEKGIKSKNKFICDLIKKKIGFEE